MKVFKFIMMAFAIASLSAAFVSCDKDHEDEFKGNNDQKEQSKTNTVSMKYMASAYLSPFLIRFFDIEGYKYTKNGDEVALYDGTLYRDTIDVVTDKSVSFGYYFKTKMTREQVRDENALTEKLMSWCDNDPTRLDSIPIYYSSIVYNTFYGLPEYQIESQYGYIIDYFNDPNSTAKSVIEKKGRFGAAVSLMRTYLSKGTGGYSISCYVLDGALLTSQGKISLEYAE